MHLYAGCFVALHVVPTKPYKGGFSLPVWQRKTRLRKSHDPLRAGCVALCQSSQNTWVDVFYAGEIYCIYDIMYRVYYI